MSSFTSDYLSLLKKSNSFSDNHPIVWYLALACLVYYCAKLSFGLTSFVKIYFTGSYPKFSNYGKWSVITGATDGIGLAFAHELANCEQNIVLISRNEEKLKTVAEALEEKYGVSTKTIAADFSNSNIYDNIAKELEKLDISVLVNNVGISYEHPELFLEISNLPTFINKTISINIMSTVKMTQIVLPIMDAKKRGIILNISSGAAAYPTPLLSLYSASKQFVDCFSRSLGEEYGGRGIIIQCIMPYYVTTKLSKIRKSNTFVPTPAKFVESALKTVGKASRTYGYFAHALESMVYGFFPESLYLWAASKTNHTIREKALKRKADKRE